MVAPNRHGQLPATRMRAHSVRNRPTDLAYQPRVLQDADRRVLLCVDVLELVVPVEAGLPAECLELLDEASVDEMDGALVDPCFRLTAAGWCERVSCVQENVGSEQRERT